jgi:thymidylate kinase
MKNKINIITFTGVDGAGKTTILREITKKIQEDYLISVKELRHRPSVLPILSAIKYGKQKASEKTMEVLPRTGTNKSTISSLLRFFYYLLDYILGQWIIYFKYTRKNVLVIYDRYYFDFIVDSRRTNIDLNNKFVSFFYKFIFKPDLNIFLYAPTEVILKRKQEMDKDSIEQLTNDYLDLFLEFNAVYKPNYYSIENIEKDKTITLIKELIKKKINA